MSWTTEEWDGFCALLEEGWPGEFIDEARQAWRVLLDDVEPAQAVQALKRLLLKGGTFRPSAAELLAEVRVDPALPTFEEALTLLRRVVRAPGFAERLRAHYKTTGSTVIGQEAEAKLREECVIAALTECHPMIQSFAVAQGLTRLERLVSATGDEEWGELRAKELREAWDRHREAGETRQVAALAAGRPGDLRKLDPLAGLQRPALALTPGQPSEGGSEQ